MLVLKIAGGIVLAFVVILFGIGVLLGATEDGSDSAGTTPALYQSSDDSRTISRAEYKAVRIGENVRELVKRFGEPKVIVNGREIARDQPDVYSWRQEGGGLIDAYQFDVDPHTGTVLDKNVF